MIAYLSGKIILSTPTFTILETSCGVGYKVMTNSAPEKGQKKEFFIFEHIREDADDLFGFETYPEIELFQKLISVNGVGPKAGMAILSAGACPQIISAISCDNVAYFLAVPGIGKKVAAKIILELKSKITGLKDAGLGVLDSSSEDIMEALNSLGYKSHEILQVLTEIPPECQKTEDKITWCLKNMKK